MSIALMTLAWRTSLPATQKLALLALCDWANDEGGSLHPSIATVAKRIGTSERQAQRVVHGLIADGWACVVGNLNGGAPGASRQYRLNVERLRTEAETGDTSVARRKPKEDAETAETGDTHVTGDKTSRVTPVSETGDTSVVRRVTPMSPNPSLNHHRTTREPPRAARKATPISFSTFLDRCKSEGEKPISGYQPVLAYAQKAGIPAEFLSLCWQEFKARYSDDSKRQKDWRRTFLNCVRGNWYGLWFAKGEGDYELTTRGLQAKKANREAA